MAIDETRHRKSVLEVQVDSASSLPSDIGDPPIFKRQDHWVVSKRLAVEQTTYPYPFHFGPFIECSVAQRGVALPFGQRAHSCLAAIAQQLYNSHRYWENQSMTRWR
jgi:hypothetical protein